MKFHRLSKSVFAILRTQLVIVPAFSIVLALFISFSLIPLGFGDSSEQQIIPDPFSTPNSTKQMVNIRARAQSPLASLSIYPPQSIISISGTLGSNGWYTSDVKISLYATKDDSESIKLEYNFYNQEWTTYTEPFTISAEGQTAIYYRVRDVSGYIEVANFQTVDIDKTPPSGSVLIEGGAEDAFSTLLNLTLSVTDAPSGPTTPPPSGYIWGVPSGPSDMRFSNNGIVWSNWEPIANSKLWTLETGAGNKTVYVQVRDNAGLVSEKFSDSINLITTGDSVAPVTSITLSGSQNSLGAYKSYVIIIMSATDDLSGIALTEYSFDSKNWTSYTAPFAISTEGQTTIYYRTHDLAGNVELTNSKTVNIEKPAKSDSISTFVVYGAVAAVALSIIVTIVLMRRRKRQFKNSLAEE